MRADLAENFQITNHLALFNFSLLFFCNGFGGKEINLRKGQRKGRKGLGTKRRRNHAPLIFNGRFALVITESVI
jgi:hypothetical protein